MKSDGHTLKNIEGLLFILSLIVLRINLEQLFHVKTLCKKMKEKNQNVKIFVLKNTCFL